MKDRVTEAGLRWAAFYLEQRAALSRYAVSLVGNVDAAQDLIQEVLVRLLRQDRETNEPRAYVLRCIRNLALDRRALRKPASLDADALAVLDDAAVGQAAEATQRVRGALARLPREYHEVIVLKIYCELTFREIAEVLDVPPGTAASHYRRGLTELKGLLEEVADDVC